MKKKFTGILAGLVLLCIILPGCSGCTDNSQQYRKEAAAALVDMLEYQTGDRRTRTEVTVSSSEPGITNNSVTVRTTEILHASSLYAGMDRQTGDHQNRGKKEQWWIKHADKYYLLTNFSPAEGAAQKSAKEISEEDFTKNLKTTEEESRAAENIRALRNADLDAVLQYMFSLQKGNYTCKLSKDGAGIRIVLHYTTVSENDEYDNDLTITVQYPEDNSLRYLSELSVTRADKSDYFKKTVTDARYEKNITQSAYPVSDEMLDEYLSADAKEIETTAENP